jgi:hypothetical protein
MRTHLCASMGNGKVLLGFAGGKLRIILMAYNCNFLGFFFVSSFLSEAKIDRSRDHTLVPTIFQLTTFGGCEL